MADWAREQGCDVVLHTDSADGSVVNRRELFQSVRAMVEQRIYDQLIIYFAGHGLLMSPGDEIWMLSDAAADGTEAVNMRLTTEHARRAGIPHVVLISDACRTYVNGPPFFGLTGGSVFPLPAGDHDDAELDIYFGTTPGNPAYEVRTSSQPGYGVFTRCLLDVLAEPPDSIIEYIEPGKYPVFGGSVLGTVPVVTSRALRPPLIEAVIDHAAEIDPLLNQRPQIRVETNLPQFFATVDEAASPSNESAHDADAVLISHEIDATAGSRPAIPAPRLRQLAASLRTADLDFSDPIHPDSVQVFVRGARAREITAVGWEIADQQQQGRDLHRLELIPASGHAHQPTSAVLTFHDRTGTLVTVVPGSSVTVVVNDGRVAGLDYRYGGPFRRERFRREWKDFELGPGVMAERYQLLALITAAAQNGDLSAALDADSSEFDSPWGRYSRDTYPGRIVFDTLRAYGGAERGIFDVGLLYDALRDGIVPFDIALLTGRSSDGRTRDAAANAFAQGLVHPFAPLLTRGWLLLGDDPTPARPYHALLARHLIPALYTTLDAGGVDIALDVLVGGAGS
jgi:hypothetical protein